MCPLPDMLKERCHRVMFVLCHVTKTQREEPAVSFCLGSSVNDAADGRCGVALWIVVLMEFIRSDDAHRNKQLDKLVVCNLPAVVSFVSPVMSYLVHTQVSRIEAAHD